MNFTALSVIQPWPFLILRPDVVDQAARLELAAKRQIKDCENRDWETPVRGWVLLHASATRLAKWDYQAAALFAIKRGVEIPSVAMRESLPYGAIVGAVRVEECTAYFRSPWFVGPRAFVFSAAVPFAKPIACDGKPRFFDVPPMGAGVGGLELWSDLAAAVRAAGLAAAFRLERHDYFPGAPGEGTNADQGSGCNPDAVTSTAAANDVKRDDPAAPDLFTA